VHCRAHLRVVLATIVVIAPVSSAVARADSPEASAKLHVSLMPEQLGRGTTIEFDFALSGTHGHAELPPPVTALSLLYPQDFGIFTSGLGLASCARADLEAFGPRACPSRSVMGSRSPTKSSTRKR
jgi:hypothetical protein